jgi:hypothetical protein
MTNAQTVYVDDSGTDTRSQIAAAAFCVSTVDKWLDFERRWRRIADRAGFRLKDFHMTEFAACRRGHRCATCTRGKTAKVEHPWQMWSELKRKFVITQMVATLVDCVECGFGIAHTKKDYEKYIRDSPVRSLVAYPVADDHYTFAVQQCGGQLAKWRAENNRKDPITFVFDNASRKERKEIDEVFFAGYNDSRPLENGVEQVFEPIGVSFENRRDTPQLLSADMVAWTIATLRSRQVFSRGRFVEAYWLANAFVSTKHIKIGYTNRNGLAQWEKEKRDAVKEFESRISDV